MDPLEIFGEDISPLILQHLSVRDIIKCSLVSNFWYEIIGQNCASKIWLRFYQPLEDVECLMKSKRKYTNFKIQRGFPEKLLPVFNKFKWKHVMLRDDIEMSYEKLVEFLQDLSPTIESLDLWDIGTKNNFENLIKIDFPKLKKLEMNLTTRAVFSLFLGHNPKLIEVTFRDESMNFRNVEQELMLPSNLLHEFLIQNHIEILKLLHCDWTFENDLTQGISSNFKRLTLTVTTNGRTTNMLANVCKFIKARPIKNVSASQEIHGGRTKYLTIYY
ncbi:hypothetical protein PVAND_006971 [Polypedilum vanderplanki]|uniref:F-box domain-containing protein n=1 Tax=Polypedilum vanderplanki TaxID=319348 RepID=A0A9J6C5D8_POLVA|nr:hypothetical protein PVAND_006971 [Polypedilum vanderplanki]